MTAALLLIGQVALDLPLPLPEEGKSAVSDLLPNLQVQDMMFQCTGNRTPGASTGGVMGDLLMWPS